MTIRDGGEAVEQGGLYPHPLTIWFDVSLPEPVEKALVRDLVVASARGRRVRVLAGQAGAKRSGAAR